VKTEKLREMTDDELGRALEDMRDELFNLRLRRRTGQLSNPLLLRTLRRRIARAMTILRERELSTARSD
jgi:large subunit ribosomal protein L29